MLFFFGFDVHLTYSSCCDSSGRIEGGEAVAGRWWWRPPAWHSWHSWHSCTQCTDSPCGPVGGLSGSAHGERPGGPASSASFPAHASLLAVASFVIDHLRWPVSWEGSTLDGAKWHFKNKSIGGKAATHRGDIKITIPKPSTVLPLPWVHLHVH